MVSFEHRVRRQSLALRCADESLALELRPRVRALNEAILLPAIERALADFDGADGLIQMGRLELDLGHLRVSELDERLAERLTTSLRAAIVAALSDRERAQLWTRDQARAELFAHYLVRGTWPAWAPRTGLAIEQLLIELAEADGAGLVALLRALASRRMVLERLVAQLSIVALERLLTVLEPNHAKLVLEYLLELELAHRFGSLVRLSDSAFHRVVWVFALAYLIREHGTQFNRKTFVKQLIAELAREWGLAYDELLAALWRGLERVEQREPLRSLPAVVDTLVGELALLRRPMSDELEDVDEPPPGSVEAVRTELWVARGLGRDRLAALIERLAHSSELPLSTLAALLLAELGGERTMAAVLPVAGPDLPRDLFEELLLALFVDDPVEASRGLQAAGELPQVLAAVVDRLRTASLRRLVGALQPDHATTVVGYVDELEASQRERPIVALAIPSFIRLVWRLTLAYLVRSPGTQFNRLRYVESLVRGMAAALGLAYELLLEALHRALIELERTAPLCSLPAVVDELITRTSWTRSRTATALDDQAVAFEPARDEDRELALLFEFDERPIIAALALRLRADVVERGAARRGGGGLSAAPAHLRYDRLRALAQFLIADEWPWEDLVDAGRSTLADPKRMLDELLVWPLLLRTVFPGRPQSLRERAIARAMTLLDERGRSILATSLGLAAELATLSDPSAPLLGVGGLERGPSQQIAALLAELGDGGQRTVLRASERTLLRRLVRRHPEVALAFLARLRATHEPWCRRLLGDAEFTGELMVALSGRSSAQAVDLLAQLGHELPGHAGEGAPARLRWRLVSTWLLAAHAGQSSAQQIRLMVEGLPISRERVVDIAAQVTAACSVEPISPAAIEQLRALLREAGPRVGRARADVGTDGDHRSMAVDPRGRAADELLVYVRARLLGSTSAAAGDARELDASLDALARLRPARLIELLEPELQQRRTCERWVASLDEPTLARLVELAAPRRARKLLAAAELLLMSWAEVGATRVGSDSDRAWLWTTVLEFLGVTARLDRNVEKFVQFVFTVVLADVDESTRERLLTHARGRAVELGHGALRAALRGRPERLGAARREAEPRTLGPRDPIGFRSTAREVEPIYIDNAGLVLLAPYLPVWMQRLELCNPGSTTPKLDDIDVASKAVHLLQWMVDGRCDAPEPSLVLNKVLCGLAPDVVVVPRHEPADAELEICEQLLRAVITHWEAIGNTSIAGLRETFLQREARLERSNERWSLKVQRKTLDVLVDQIPWTTSVIGLAWMPYPLHVSW